MGFKLRRHSKQISAHKKARRNSRAFGSIPLTRRDQIVGRNFAHLPISVNLERHPFFLFLFLFLFLEQIFSFRLPQQPWFFHTANMQQYHISPAL